MQPKRKTTNWKRSLSTVVLVLFLSITFWQRQNILDWWTLRDYTPTVAAAQLATDSGMTDEGRRLFYLQKPQVQDKVSFYKSCEEGETSIVLGCYKPNFGIFLLGVSDPRLEGVEQVTAAHEMLHAAYDRLSYSDQKRIAKLLQDTYKTITDADIRDKIKQYQDNGADISNELHSILPTEVSVLPNELEEYYSRYFNNRQDIVTFASAYKGEFQRRKAKVDDLDKQLTALEAEVLANNEALNAQQASIQAESKRLDALLRAGSIDEYNQGVVAYNQSLIPFRAMVNRNRQLVAKYRTILEERNAVATEAQELEKALDSRIQNTVEDI